MARNNRVRVNVRALFLGVMFAMLFTTGLATTKPQAPAHKTKPQLVQAPTSSKPLNVNGTVLMRKGNHAVLSGTVNTESVDSIIETLNDIYYNTLYDLDDSEKDVLIYIASGGGSVTAGNRLIEQMRFLKSQGVTVACVADFAFSMAFATLQHCDKRYVMATSVVMQHQMSTSNIGGSFNNIMSYIDFVRQLNENLDSHQAERIGLSLHDFHKKTEHDWWLLGDNILRNNVADEIVNVGCSQELFNMRKNITIHTMFFDVRVELSGCPLLKTPLSITPIGNKSINPKLAETVAAEYARNMTVTYPILS